MEKLLYIYDYILRILCLYDYILQGTGKDQKNGKQIHTHGRKWTTLASPFDVVPL